MKFTFLTVHKVKKFGHHNFLGGSPVAAFWEKLWFQNFL